MGSRIDSKLDLIIAMPLIDRYIENENDYFKKKDEVLEVIREFVSKNCELETNILFNVLDSPGRGLAGCYLTITGTCAENADSGEVGRGNRVNGVIPLNRPVSNEAAAGKNPVSHVGKIYNILSHIIAREIQEKVSGIEEVYVWLLSQIGQPISYPKLASVQIITSNGVDETMKKEAQEIVEKHLDNIKEFCVKLAEGKYKLY
jgi:S-adenosylmethionine synthetase